MQGASSKTFLGPITRSVRPLESSPSELSEHLEGLTGVERRSTGLFTVAWVLNRLTAPIPPLPAGKWLIRVSIPLTGGWGHSCDGQ